MRALIFVLSTILILAAIILVVKNEGDRFLGLELKKKWVLVIVIAEFVLLILAILDYNQNVNADIANDLLWHNMISYYRGVLPIAGLAELIDFKMNNIFSTGLLMLLGALFSDYIVLRVTSMIKKWVRK